MVRDATTIVKEIIEKLTLKTTSTLSEKVFNIAAERGIGDILVSESIQKLVEDNFISEPVCGVLKKI